MAIKPDHQKVKQILIDAISILCKNGLAFKSELCIEGLLGITLDNNEIFLVNIKETMRSDAQDNSTTTDVMNISDADAEVCLGAIEDLSMRLGAIEDLSTRKRKQAMRVKIDSHNVDAMLDAYLQSCSTKNDLASIGTDDRCELDLVKDLTVRERRTDDIINQLADRIYAEDLTCILPKDMSQKDDSNLEADLLIVKTSDGNALTCSQADSFVAQTVWDATVDCLNSVVTLPMTISEPQKTVENINDLLHVEEEEKKMMCKMCGKGYKNEHGLKKHKCKQRATPMIDEIRVVHLENGGQQPLDLTTGHLEGELGDGDIISFELQDDQTWCASTSNTNATTQNKLFNCVCSKSFNDSTAYINHVASCKKSKTAPYSTCDICGKYFFSNSGFVKHRRFHVGAYNFRCHICHKGFFDRTHMRSHVDSSHSKVRRHECPKCHQGFFWKHHLKRHLNTCGRIKTVGQPTTNGKV